MVAFERTLQRYWLFPTHATISHNKSPQEPFFLTWVNGAQRKCRHIYKIAKLIYIKCAIDIYQIIKREPIFFVSDDGYIAPPDYLCGRIKDKKIVVWMTNWQRWTKWAVARLISRFLWCWAAVAPPWQRRRPRRPNHRWCSWAFMKGQGQNSLGWLLGRYAGNQFFCAHTSPLAWTSKSLTQSAPHTTSLAYRPHPITTKP